MQKRLLPFVLLSLPWLLPAVFAAEVKPGDDYDRVRYVLGNPKGEVRQGDLTYLYYDRGVIELKNREVVTVDLMTQREAAKRNAELRRAEQDRARAEQEKSERVRREGEEEKRRTLDDPEFAKKSPGEKLDYWNQFRHRYPGVSVESEYQEVRTASEEAEKESVRVSELEDRLQQLEREYVEERPQLSGSKLRKERRRFDPAIPPRTPDYLPPYRYLGGTPRQYP